MAGPPGVGPRRVSQVLFDPKMKLDPSQVVDMRVPASPMRYVTWEDGTNSWITDPWPGGININNRHPPTPPVEDSPGGRGPVSRQYTKISAAKPPPKKALVRPVRTMSAMLGTKAKTSFKSMGAK